MEPLGAISQQAAQRLVGVLFDLDDTLLSHGTLSLRAYEALFRLAGAGLHLIGVTGRPIGWAEVLARQWPVLGVVAENGALAASVQNGKFARHDPVPGSIRQERRNRLAALRSEIHVRFPALAPADDVAARVSDYTFDIGENQAVAADVVKRVAAFARERGARTTTSSVHLHISYDTHDKASGTLAFVGHRLGLDPTLARWTHCFVGDSQNDAACFAAFPFSVGVANLARDMTILPRYIASRPRGDGFAELATRLVELRRGQTTAS